MKALFKSRHKILAASFTTFFFIVIFHAFGERSSPIQEADKIKKQQQSFQQNKSSALQEMYNTYPNSKSLLQKSYGYAAFANTGVNLLVLASGNGGGVAHNNKNGEEKYVKMISLGAGIGLGLKKYYAVFLFEDKAAYEYFLEEGWSADGQADATADTGKEGEGGSAAVGMNISRGVTLYQVANKGVALQATVQGTKYIVAEELNK